MTGGRIDKPDTAADMALRKKLSGETRGNFSMVAGAGSGKTTSLVKALSAALDARGQELKRSRRRVACITYTEIAAREIWADVGNNPLLHVSTIHSFLWTITSSFQSDIKTWVLRRIDERIADLEDTAANFGSRVHQRTRDKNAADIVRYRASIPAVKKVQTFTYSTGSDYPKGKLGHDDIIRMATDLMLERELFRTLIAQQFPIVFVDESQDTQPVVVDALMAVARQAGKDFCLGFFGDPMQRIYATGIGDIPLEEGWVEIPKEENFRCPASVLAVANAIRHDGDDLVQTGGRKRTLPNGTSEAMEGSARIFVLQADGKRDENLAAVREFMAREQGDPAWSDGPDSAFKMLVIVHRMAANRLGFGQLYEAMNDGAPSYFSDGFLEGTSWPLKPFEVVVMPIVEAAEAGNEFAVISLLRKFSPGLEREALARVDAAELLALLREAVGRLCELMADGNGTVHDVLVHLADSGMMTFDPRLEAYIGEPKAAAAQNGGAQAEDDETIASEITAMDLFLACPASQLRGYRNYVRDLSPFSTQQGIKGAEFERVLVVLDDEEGRHNQFSYDKYFKVKPPSKRDEENVRDGKETSIDRTRRLFYVSCTRALQDLVVVYFSDDAALAEQKVRDAGIFPDNSILTAAALS